MKVKIPTQNIEDLEQIIPELNPSEKLNYFLVICPFCDKKEAFIYKGDNVIICNRRNKCGKTIGLYEYLKDIKKLNDKEIVDIIIEENEQNSDVIELLEQEEEIKVPTGTKFFNSADNGVVQNKFKNYLLNRKISIDKIYDKLGYIFNSETKYNNSIFIPFYENGKLVYFTVRKVDDDYYRYINSDNQSIDKVYNIDEIIEDKDVFVFEGVLDALSLSEEQVGTAILTSIVSKQKANKIIDKIPKNIIIVPDMDFAGISNMFKNLKLFEERIPPSTEIGLYYFILDWIAFNKITEILHKKISLDEKMKLAERVRTTVKDFNDYVKTYRVREISLNDCIKYSNAIKDKKFDLKEMFSKSRSVI